MTKAAIGLIGLGTMGSNLALNIADHGFGIAVFNRTTQRTVDFHASAGRLAGRIQPCHDLEQLVKSIRPPRAIILMVPAGPVVDEQIAVLRPLLEKGDVIIDAGNANFADTNRRAKDAAEKGEVFIGMGVSGGEEGARFGPSLMGGGPKAAWQRLAPIFEAIAADYEGVPCATWMGEAGAGHFVKMVHNGIEYADMQMIGEVYGLMRDGLGMTAPDMAKVFSKWNKGRLRSYLIEITAEIANTRDDATGMPVLDIILDRAGQKGTGRWTAIEALHLASPVTAIDAAVAARNMSSRLEERKMGESIFGPAPGRTASDQVNLAMLENALLAGKIACYAQGFAMLSAASSSYGWSLPMPEIAKVWRAGCIIRSAMLNDMAQALADKVGENLMFSPFFADLLKASQKDLRKVVAAASLSGNPVPALGAGLSYFDLMRTSRSTANMIQAQRDFFGAHSFERTDQPGSHHGPWSGVLDG
jgi:6-phosphogluconate dehydrogenase